MTKKEIWSAVERILENYGVDSRVKKELAVYLQPMRGGGRTSPVYVDAEGQEWYLCRYTNRLFKVNSMAFKDDESREKKISKGYSTVGLRLWARAKKLKDDLREALTDEIMSEEPNLSRVEELKGKLRGFDYNTSETILSTLTDEEHEDLMEATLDPEEVI